VNSGKKYLTKKIRKFLFSKIDHKQAWSALRASNTKKLDQRLFLEKKINNNWTQLQ
jgi:hypothetical protein